MAPLVCRSLFFFLFVCFFFDGNVPTPSLSFQIPEIPARMNRDVSLDSEIRFDLAGALHCKMRIRRNAFFKVCRALRFDEGIDSRKVSSSSSKFATAIDLLSSIFR